MAGKPLIATDHPFTEDGILRYAPVAGGVYLIHSDTKWIYAGQSDNIYRRLNQHLDGDDRIARCIRRHGAQHFRYEEVSYFERDRREREVIDYYNPECNKA